MRVVIHSDGSKTTGAAVAYDEDGRRLAERARIVRDATVPVCEYVGLIVGMRLARDLGATSVECWMDAELVAHQVTGDYACRPAHLLPYLAQARALMEEFDEAEVRLFPKAGPKMKRRYLNGEADGLAAECARVGRNIDRRCGGGSQFFSSRFGRVMGEDEWNREMEDLGPAMTTIGA